MKILLTGGFGTVGVAVLERLLERGHEATVLEVEGPRTRRAARRWESRGARVRFGDIRDPEAAARAAEGRDAIVHCAALLPPMSERNPGLCDAVNVGGTRSILAAAAAVGGIPLVYLSSASVMGPTQDREPPVRVDDPLNPTDAYSRSKAEAEALVRSSGLRHCVLRLGAVMPRNLMNVFKQLELAFDIPLAARCEVVLDRDVATACARAAELLAAGGSIDGRTFFVGGGTRRGCQLTARSLYESLFGAFGLDLPPERLFSADLGNYYIDWYDTEAAQELLGFQEHGFEEYRAELARRFRALVPLIRAFRPLVSRYVSSRSPYGR